MHRATVAKDMGRHPLAGDRYLALACNRNMLGQNVYNTELNEGKTQVNFTQTSGIYFYRILSLEGNVTSTGKLIVK